LTSLLTTAATAATTAPTEQPELVKTQPEALVIVPTAETSETILAAAAEPSTLATPSSAHITESWYVVQTKPRQELLALVNLERQGYECYLPQMRIERVRRNKARIVTEAMFPRYLFIRLDNSGFGKSWSPIRSTLGVSNLVRFGTQVAKVGDRVIDFLRSNELAMPTESMFKQGQTVVITDGPFAGIEAIYQTADAEGRSLILLELLSKPTQMRIETECLRKADAGTVDDERI
jgi:transcriptional antiterminator RfaH